MDFIIDFNFPLHFLHQCYLFFQSVFPFESQKLIQKAIDSVEVSIEIHEYRGSFISLLPCTFGYLFTKFVLHYRKLIHIYSVSFFPKLVQDCPIHGYHQTRRGYFRSQESFLVSFGSSIDKRDDSLGL